MRFSKMGLQDAVCRLELPAEFLTDSEISLGKGQLQTSGEIDSEVKVRKNLGQHLREKQDVESWNGLGWKGPLKVI